MPEGTEASQWAPSSTHATKEPAHKEPAAKEPAARESTGNPRGGRGRGGNNNKRNSRPARKHSTNTTTGAASAESPTQPSADAPPKPKLIDRLSAPPEAASAASPPTATKSDSPDSKHANGRRRGGGRDRPGSKRGGRLPAKVNTAAAQKELEKEIPEIPKVEEPEAKAEAGAEAAADPEQAQDAVPHINSTDFPDDPPPTANGLADRLKAANPSAPTTPRPFTPSAIDWAGETEDGSLPDLDDWGVSAKSSSPTHKDEENSKPTQEKTAPVADTKPNDRNPKRKGSKAGKDNLAVPTRNGARGNSSRPVTPSSTGFASPSLRSKPMPARTSSRASIVNDAPPHITVTPNPSTEETAPPKGLGLDFVDEPVFASLNDPPLEPPPEAVQIKPVRSPNTHNNGRGGRGRGGRGRVSDGNSQARGGPGFGPPMHMHMGPPSPHMPPSPHLPPSPYMPPSPYLPNAPFPPNGFQPGYNPGVPMGYPQPHSPGFGGPGPGPGYGHQHSYSHPQPRSNNHHSRNNHQESMAPRHQRAHSRPIIAGSALSSLRQTVQDTASPPRSRANVSS